MPSARDRSPPRRGAKPPQTTYRSLPLLCPECGARNLPEAAECVACERELPRDGDDELDPLIGRTIAGRYALQSILGEGSMGVVYAARQEGLDHEVAVKVLHEHVAADPKVKRRFHREARMTSRLTHPNTVRIFDFGRGDDGMLYLAMELLDGIDLLELLEEEEPLTPRRMVSILRQVLLALEEAHDRGIVHRDLKPENVMVVDDHQGREIVKVCDFGIAKLVEAEGTAITVTGFVCGTPEYMAPEQARGEALDPRADIYALGCLLYRMLTGVVPYQGASALATITSHLTQPLVRPRLRAPERHIPHALERVCLRALAKAPADRYADAAAMRRALDDALTDVGDIAEDPLGTHVAAPSIRAGQLPPKAMRAWRRVGLALGVVAVIGVVFAASAWLSSNRRERGEEGPAATPPVSLREPPASPVATAVSPTPSTPSDSNDDRAPGPPLPLDERGMSDSKAAPPTTSRMGKSRDSARPLHGQIPIPL